MVPGIVQMQMKERNAPREVSVEMHGSQDAPMPITEDMPEPTFEVLGGKTV